MLGNAMIDRLKAWLAEPDRPRGGGADELRLAVAALLIEAAHTDDHFGEAERAVVARVLEQRFALPQAAARELLAGAETVAARSAQLFRFTQIINERMSPEQRIRVIEMLWEVAYADGHLDPLEDTLLRRVGGLIYVPDHERGAARQRVLSRRRAEAAQPPETKDGEPGPRRPPYPKESAQ